MVVVVVGMVVVAWASCIGLVADLIDYYPLTIITLSAWLRGFPLAQ